MKEIFKNESKIIAASLLIALGGTACSGKSNGEEGTNSIIKARNEFFMEHKSADIKYSENYRRVTISPGELVFEEFCQNRNMHLRRLSSKTLLPISEAVVVNAKECQDNKITPSDFGEQLKPANEFSDLPH